MTTEQMDQTDNDRLTLRSNERADSAKSELARNARMDRFIMRIVTVVTIFVLVTVLAAAVPVLVSLYRSVFGG